MWHHYRPEGVHLSCRGRSVTQRYTVIVLSHWGLGVYVANQPSFVSLMDTTNTFKGSHPSLEAAGLPRAAVSAAME